MGHSIITWNTAKRLREFNEGRSKGEYSREDENSQDQWKEMTKTVKSARRKEGS